MARTTTEFLPVTWRDGIHLSGTPLWCDAHRARDVCFLSNAHALPGTRHGQLIATAPTLMLFGESATSVHLAVPYGRPFTLGSVRLELICSGHGLGGASLLVDVDGHRLLYTNGMCSRGGGLGGHADVRPCDTLVLGARYGDPRFCFPPVDEVLPGVLDFILETTGRGGAAVLLVSTPSKALDVSARLTEVLEPRADATSAPSITAHRRFHEAVQALRPSHPELPRVRRNDGRSVAGHVLLWPVDQVERLAKVPGVHLDHSRVALLSGAALANEEPGRGVHAAFPWSDLAGHDELLRYIDASQASQVYLTDEYAEPLAAALDRPDRPCHALGPPRQIELF